MADVSCTHFPPEQENIASRLYTKYHAEACMHYGREFLSKGLWDTDQAKHLRGYCGKVLGSWGMGVSSQNCPARIVNCAEFFFGRAQILQGGSQ